MTVDELKHTVTPSATTKNDLFGSLRDQRIERCVASNREQIAEDAVIAGADHRTFERQVRLHLPSAPHDLLDRHEFGRAYATVRSIALVRSATIAHQAAQANLQANVSLLLPKHYTVKRGLMLCADDGSRLPLKFGTVKPSIGFSYQADLHYLKSIRGDTSMHFGIFLPGADHPLTYVALSVCDRPYMSDLLMARQLDCSRVDCMVITRMYGLPGIPANLMSVTLRYVTRVLRDLPSGPRILLTACNPLLGFNGAAFRASGFSPFALAPVSYRYNVRGEFTTRRNGKREREISSTSRNVLMIRGVGTPLQREILRSVQVSHISPDAHQRRVTLATVLPDLDDAVWLKHLEHYRDVLEEAWSVRTVHPSYLGENFSSSSSRGQCGVSSVWLARELERAHGVESTYCYGDLTFLDGVSIPVRHHCWIEVGDPGSSRRVVVDITCDQAENIPERVLSASHEELLTQGLHYMTHTRLTVDELPNDRVWHRFKELDDIITERIGQTGLLVG